MGGWFLFMFHQGGGTAVVTTTTDIVTPIDIIGARGSIKDPIGARGTIKDLKGTPQPPK